MTRGIEQAEEGLAVQRSYALTHYQVRDTVSPNPAGQKPHPGDYGEGNLGNRGGVGGGGGH